MIDSPTDQLCTRVFREILSRTTGEASVEDYVFRGGRLMVCGIPRGLGELPGEVYKALVRTYVCVGESIPHPTPLETRA